MSSLQVEVGISKSFSTLFLSGWMLTSPLGWAVSNSPLKVTLGAILNLVMLNFKNLCYGLGDGSEAELVGLESAPGLKE